VGDYGHGLEFGAFVTPSARDADRVVALAALADRLGLDVVTFQDHPYQARFLDTWTLLAYVAARTERIRLAANVLNLPLRSPAIVARSVASLDVLSGGRAELGLGAGAFWDGIEALGGPRRTPGESVEALDEAIDVVRLLWDVDAGGPAELDGRHYRLHGAARGPAPLHRPAIWVGAYRPRMLRLTGRKADGWLPSLPYLGDGDLAAGNAAIDAAAVAAGREPSAIRRLLNVPAGGATEEWAEELAELALANGVGTFIAMADDPETIERFATEVAPAVRARVDAARAGAAGSGAAPPPAIAPTGAAPAPAAGGSEYERLGVTPTPDDGTRLTARLPWDESTRPRRPRSGADVVYSRRGRLVGQHLVDVHDMLRTELRELRGVLEQVRDGALAAGAARAALNEMALRQNDWTLGAFCSRYCGVVTQHHGLEDGSIFPHLARSEPTLGPVIDRLTEEHLAIHDAVQAVDAALVAHIRRPDDYAPIQGAIDALTDALLSHLSYEEEELVEPLARLGFYPGQV
jgi:alkanesulfonate monooxygenase SsuD/methylene tetrahydromethanopterin reductase-like flavin-dependent oxidoreductase (luciferase family)